MVMVSGNDNLLPSTSQVWIVDEANGKPRQVITMSDVLRSLLEVQ